MTKSQFLKLLKEKLDVLEDSEIEDILAEYENHIEEKVKSGKTAKQAIEDFGDIDELVKDILSAYKIKGNKKTASSKTENIFNTVVDEMVNFFQQLGNIFNQKSGEDIIRIICKVIIVLLLIWVLRFPFYIIEEIGKNILSGLPSVFDHSLSALWSLSVNLIYFVMGIMLVYRLIKKLIIEENANTVSATSQKRNEEKRSTMKQSETKQDSKISYIDDEKKENKKVEYLDDQVGDNTKIQYRETKQDDPTSVLLTLLMVIVKIFAVLVSMPILFGLVGLIIFFGMMIAAACSGVYIISLFFIIGGLIIMGTSILGMIYHVAFQKGGRF